MLRLSRHRLRGPYPNTNLAEPCGRQPWNTSLAEFEFSGRGTHTFDLAGVNGAGFANNFAWGTLVIDVGDTLALGTGSGDALYVNFRQGLDVSGNMITNIDGTPGLFVYYNPADNPLLQGNYNLTGGGEMIAAGGAAATPEPGTLLLMLSGVGSLLARRRWRRSPCGGAAGAGGGPCSERAASAANAARVAAELAPSAPS